VSAAPWITAEQIVDESVAEKRRSWWQRIPTVKRMMLIVTALWPVMGVFFAYLFAESSYSRYTFYENGMAVRNGYSYTENEAWARSMTSGLFASGFITTAIYAGLMFVLLVVWFCTKTSAREA
jgi:hypothetical protein